MEKVIENNRINEEKEPVVVACAADNFFSIPLAVAAFSALKNLDGDRKMICCILDGGISKANREKIVQTLDSSRVEVRWIKPTSEQIQRTLLKCRASSHPISNYYRLLLPAILPTQFHKVIYLDSDVVVEGNLAELWDCEIGDNYVLAVQDPVHRSLLRAEHLKSLHLERQGITADNKYLNAGVLVINLERWRQDKIADQILKCIAKNPDFPFPDQDAINIVLAGKWGEISPLWNQMHVVHNFESPQDSPYDQSVYPDLIDNPRIIHYTSRPKPWGKNCTHPQANRYFTYLDQTAWSGWRNTPLVYSVTLMQRVMRRTMMAVSKSLSRV